MEMRQQAGIGKHFKIIIPVVILMFFIPIFISSSFTVAKTVPAIKPEEIQMYIKVTTSIAEDKTRVDWRDLISIDAVRYHQDFSKVTEDSIYNLAEMFIVTNIEYEYQYDDNGNLIVDEYGNPITVTVISYSTKSIDDVMDELGFTEQEKRDANIYKSKGLSAFIGNGGSGGGASLSQEEFFERLKPGAIEGYVEYGVFPSITMVQAIIESTWGTSGLTDQANNLFGIKGYNWDGPIITMMTTEYYGGVPVDVPAPFRVYPSWDDSILDHALFLYENSRYAEHGAFNASNAYEQAFAIAEAGYATDPEYGIKLINAIDCYGLTKYDDMAIEAAKKSKK